MQNRLIAHCATAVHRPTDRWSAELSVPFGRLARGPSAARPGLYQPELTRIKQKDQTQSDCELTSSISRADATRRHRKAVVSPEGA